VSSRRAGLNRLWLPIQSIALISAIVSPILFKVEEQDMFNRGLSERKIIPNLAVSYRPVKPSTITSNILRLPLPIAGDALPSVTVNFQARQLRFEAELSKAQWAPEIRSPASVPSFAKGSEWSLEKIEKKLPNGNLEAVELVSGNSAIVGSTYVELSDGENEFVVTFKNLEGEEKSYPVKVNRI